MEDYISNLENMISQSEKGGVNSQKHITQLMDILKDEYMVELLSYVHKALVPFY